MFFPRRKTKVPQQKQQLEEQRFQNQSHRFVVYFNFKDFNHKSIYEEISELSFLETVAGTS